VKKSWYQILISDLIGDYENKKFPKSAIIRVEENVTVYEFDEKNGITREDILKKDLER
jgi:hypothetical protein